jgi:hypothetical protein
MITHPCCIHKCFFFNFHFSHSSIIPLVVSFHYSFTSYTNWAQSFLETMFIRSIVGLIFWNMYKRSLKWKNHIPCCIFSFVVLTIKRMQWKIIFPLIWKTIVFNESIIYFQELCSFIYEIRILWIWIDFIVLGIFDIHIWKWHVE